MKQCDGIEKPKIHEQQQQKKIDMNWEKCCAESKSIPSSIKSHSCRLAAIYKYLIQPRHNATQCV